MTQVEGAGRQQWLQQARGKNCGSCSWSTFAYRKWRTPASGDCPRVNPIVFGTFHAGTTMSSLLPSEKTRAGETR